MASSFSSIIGYLARPEHQRIWNEVSEAAMKDGIEPEQIRTISPYVFVAMEKIRKELNCAPSSAAKKRRNDGPSNLGTKKPSTLSKPPNKEANVSEKSKERKEKEESKETKGKNEEGKKKKPNLAREFDALKDYNLTITGIPTIQVEESPKLKVIKLPYMAPEKMTAVLKDVKGWDKTNHAVVVVPRAWSEIEGSADEIYNLKDMLECFCINTFKCHLLLSFFRLFSSLLCCTYIFCSSINIIMILKLLSLDSFTIVFLAIYLYFRHRNNAPSSLGPRKDGFDDMKKNIRENFQIRFFLFATSSRIIWG